MKWKYMSQQNAGKGGTSCRKRLKVMCMIPVVRCMCRMIAVEIAAKIFPANGIY